MLAVFLVGVLVGLGVAVWLDRGPSEREEALLAEVDALRAVNRLSLAAWQARHALREEVQRQAGR